MMIKTTSSIALFMLAFLSAANTIGQAKAQSSTATDSWAFYGGDAGSTRYSPLTQITAANVAGLKPVWTFHTGDVSPGGKGMQKSGFETTPLFLDGKLYLTTSFNRVIALDPAGGTQLWAFDPKIDKTLPYGDGLINRGLAAWHNPSAPDCKLTLFETTLDARLIAVDGATGAPCPRFGDHGQVALTNVTAYRDGWYHMTSPPIVVDGVVVVGSAIDDNSRADMPAGTVRGYDARTGKPLWSWEPLQRPANASQWLTGAGNAWSIMSADPKRHLVFVPTGSASPDYYGGMRPGDDHWADSVVALDARTGKLAWGFQLVHHDLWDYDTAAGPVRTDLRLNGVAHSAVIAGNKTGMLYVLDADSGKPLLPVAEKPVPQSSVPGEKTSPTQPFPLTLPALSRQSLTPADAWGASDADREYCRAAIAKADGKSIFAPPSLDGSLAVPGNIGGINWSGFAWDARNQRLIVAISNLPYQVQMIPAEKLAETVAGNFRAEIGPQRGAPFAMTRTAFLSPSGLPCIAPPWGELVALDLATGKIAWRHALGSTRDIFPSPVGDIPGSPILGGPIVTAGGVIFSGGTMDRRIHALSADTGDELWSADLPASAHAQPITYEAGGKQYVVIAAGGSAKLPEPQSDAVVAFALP